MPLAKMRKISLLAPRESRETLVDRLHQLGAVQVADIQWPSGEEKGLEERHVDSRLDARGLRLGIAKTEFVIETLESVEKAKSGLISGFLKEKVHVTHEEFMTIESRLDLESVYRELEELDIQRRHAEGRISDGEEELEALKPWKDLDCPLGGCTEAESVELYLAVAGRGILPDWEEEMEALCPYAHFEEVSREGERVFLAALVHKDNLEEFENLASRFNLERAQFPGRTGTVREEMELLERELAAERGKKEAIKEEVKKRLHLKPDVCTLQDYLRNQLNKEEAKERLVHTERVVALEGWVEESRAEEVVRGLEELGVLMDISLTDPEESDIPPTLLVNRRRVKPAENLINLFGLPSHDETDPTPFVSPFFILFFGMCIGDVGYGLILAASFWLAMRKLDVSEATRSFFRLFMYCGIATVLVGIFTRGYFGIKGEWLPGFMKFPGTMDLLYKPVPFMLICLALGLIHISIGVAIEMYDNIRNNSVWLGVCEQGTTLLCWFGLAVLAVGMGVHWNPLLQAGIYITMAGVAGIVLLSNIQSKSILGKFFGGLYNLYGLFAGTIGDVASYLRLYALGLATVAIGGVVNEMAGLVWGIPALGFVLLIVVLAGGHIFNIAINFLSAFVHPLRLQYVEFFGKFYEDGGEPFLPLGLETSKVVIDKE